MIKHENAMVIDLDVKRIADGYFVSSKGITGLQVWHADPHYLAGRLPHIAERLLRRNHELHAQVRIVDADLTPTTDPVRALLDEHPRLLVQPLAEHATALEAHAQTMVLKGES